MKLTARKVQLLYNQGQWTVPNNSHKYSVMRCDCTLCGGRVQFQGSLHGFYGGKSGAGTWLRVILLSGVSGILNTAPYSCLHEVNSSLYSDVNNSE